MTGFSTAISTAISLPRRRFLSRTALFCGGAAAFAAFGGLAPGGGAIRMAQAATARQDIAFDVFWDDDRIGSHRFKVSPGASEGDWTVEVVIDMVVDLGLFGEITFRHDCTEQWKAGRLSRLSSTTNDDGESFTVTGEARGEDFALEGPGGPFLAAGTLLTSSSAWSVDICNQSQIIDVTHGDVIGVVTEEDGKRSVTVGSRTVDAVRFNVMSPLIAGTLLYGPDNTWLGGVLQRSGADINYVRRA